MVIGRSAGYRCRRCPGDDLAFVDVAERLEAELAIPIKQATAACTISCQLADALDALAAALEIRLFSARLVKR